MLSRATASVLFALFGLAAGCNDDTLIQPDPAPEIENTVETTAQNGHLRLRLQASIYPDDQGVFLVVEATNIGPDLIRYVSGGCGCPLPRAWVVSAEGELCPELGPRPLCPCWIETVSLAPGEAVIHGGGSVCAEGTAQTGLAYEVLENGYWNEESLEIRLPLSDGGDPDS